MGTTDTQIARWYAIAKHGDQQYGHQPYSYHLDDAVNQLIVHVLELPALRFYDHDVIICATYLHDVLEDTETTIEELDKLFDRRIGALVQAVTDGPGKNRRERKAGVYKAIRTVGPAALAVKLADRLGNAKTAGLAKDGSSMLDMYRKEQPGFERELCCDLLPPESEKIGRGGECYLENITLRGFAPAFIKIREYLGL